MPGMDIVVLSAYDDEALQNQLRRLRMNGSSVHLMVLPQEEVKAHA